MTTFYSNSENMVINHDTIQEAINEVFHQEVPKRLAEYWFDTYSDGYFNENIHSYKDLTRILRSEYETYHLGMKDSDECHQVICSHCASNNEFTEKTGYKLIL